MTSDVTGLLGIIGTLIALIGKIWFDSSSNARRMTDVVEKNAIAMTKLGNFVDLNTQATVKSTEATNNLSNRIENVLTGHSS